MVEYPLGKGVVSGPIPDSGSKEKKRSFFSVGNRKPERGFPSVDGTARLGRGNSGATATELSVTGSL